MDFAFKELQQQLLKTEIKEVAKALGYRNVVSVKKRIDTIVKSQNFLDWMHKNGGYDLKYSRMEFIKKLNEFLKIDPALLELDIIAYNEHEEKFKREFQSYIFIYTGFRRKNEPIFALAMLSNRRYIYIDKEQTMIQDFSAKFAHAKELIKEHMHITGGDLGIWGKIKSYVWHYDEHRSITFALDGSIEEFNSSIDEPLATLSLKGITL